MKMASSLILASLVFSVISFAAEGEGQFANCTYRAAYVDKNSASIATEHWPVTEKVQQLKVEMKGSNSLKEGTLKFEVPGTTYVTKLTLMYINNEFGRSEKLFTSALMVVDKKLNSPERLVSQLQGSSMDKPSEGKLLSSVSITNFDLVNEIAKLGYSAEDAASVIGDGSDRFEKLVTEGKLPNGMLAYQNMSCSF